ncbi:putative ethanolamine-phosphate cytidylyltransferase [Trypanosoma grayi]|uniref:putative ethanolamine-phosphate cytidylyltransferase n=1 Tax=Trypanosoma grayi TaxID=71804 RepID=UPI0004F3F630|nr:putative ethanolamine-phosphate cytidylyltransferase [Trypanosoma grayi]KEG13459.1 putative ethanolamine-phosphate cytidylyltransferase [Trypanosoma grayi]
MSCGKVHLNADDPANTYPLYAAELLPPKRPGTVRVWVDGCFDLMHFGHANALRQAASLGDELLVGCHSDAEIIRYKGPPIMHEVERYEALRACKWVNYVVENYPYVTRLADMDRFEVDFVVHGDDISVDLNGRNSYQEIIDAGRFKVVKRTESISTTNLVGRMLLCSPGSLLSEEEKMLLAAETSKLGAFHYLTTSRKIAQFSNGRSSKPGDRIVYVDGSFDLFHYGHIRVLQKARELGNYLIAGVHEDSVIRRAKGKNFPIMSLNERVLGVLSCRYVDEVVLGAPYEVTREVIENLGISVVVGGKTCDAYESGDCHDAYAVPKGMGCYQEVDSGCDLTTYTLIERVVTNEVAYLKRQAAKRAKDEKNAEAKLELYKNVTEV